MNSKYLCSTEIIKNIDLICALLCSIMGILIISLSFVINLHQQSIGITLLLASLIFLLKRSELRNHQVKKITLGSNTVLKLNIFYYLIFVASLCMAYTDLYNRPSLYFILIAILAGLIGLEIYYMGDEKSTLSPILKIILLSLNIRAILYYNYPSIIGYDAYQHAMIAEWITNTGFVAPVGLIGKYSSYSIFHIFVSITQIVMDTNIKDAIFFSIGFASVLSTIFIYYFGKKVAGAKVGLMSILLINITHFNIVRGIANITPGSLVFCYFALILFLMFSKKKNVTYNLMIVGITSIMILTHQLTTFVVLISIILLFIGNYAYGLIYKQNYDVRLNYILFFAIMLSSYWMYSYASTTDTFFEFILEPLISVLGSGGEYGSDTLVVGYEYQRSNIATFILQSCYLILPFLGIGGVLIWLSSKCVMKYQVVCSIIVLYILVYGIPLLGIRNFLTHRWMALLAIFVVIASSEYIIKIASIINSNKYKIITLFIIIFTFTFLMLITPAINKDSPVIEKDTSVRNQFKASEISAANKIGLIATKEIRADEPFDSCIRYYGTNDLLEVIDLNERIITFDDSYLTQSSSEDSGSLVILRKTLLTESFSLRYSTLYGLVRSQTLTNDFLNKFTSNHYDLIYNNGNNIGYLAK